MVVVLCHYKRCAWIHLRFDEYKGRKRQYEHQCKTTHRSWRAIIVRNVNDIPAEMRALFNTDYYGLILSFNIE